MVWNVFLVFILRKTFKTLEQALEDVENKEAVGSIDLCIISPDLDELTDTEDHYDVIVCNPNYIPKILGLSLGVNGLTVLSCLGSSRSSSSALSQLSSQFESSNGAWQGRSVESYQLPRRSSVWGYFTPPILQRVPLQPRETPMEAMVDLTNNLGIAILQDHFFSRNNFAFSPYGVASVLVVLYEGAKGESARQIHRAIKFPSDKDVIRVGFRDIHRHLRSYFSHEGYLSGISLNKESSSLKPEYKKILKFYGYDVDLNQTFEEEHDGDFENVSSPPTTSIPSQISNDPDSEMTSFIQNGNKSTTTSQNSEKGNTEIVEPTAITEPSPYIPDTTEQQSKETTVKVPSTSVIVSLDQEVTEPPKRDEGIEKTDASETERIKTTTSFAKTDPQVNEFQTTLAAENNGKQNAKDYEKEIDDATEQNKVFSSTLAEGQKAHTMSSSDHPATESEAETTGNEKIEEITNVSIDNGMLIPQSDDLGTTTTEKSAMLTEPYPLTMDITALDITEIITEGFERTTGPSTQEDSSLGNRNDIKLSKETKGDEKFIKNIRNIVDTKLSLWLTEKKKSVSRKTRTITDYLKSPHNPELSLQLQNGMYDTHISRNADLYRSLPRVPFLVDGAVDTPVPMMTYTNVFPYAYIPRLHSKALKFPLDDIRYKLLILLPVERRGLRQLIYDLADFPLRNILECLRPARVKAMVPTFMVEGFVILTSSLQKLGIWDVFDPRKANLSGMSLDPELYVRNVEQSVTVVIRNYVEILDIQTRTMAARHIDYEFDTTHPFLYFVLDEVTNVALMAGQILDPLNSRIY